MALNDRLKLRSMVVGEKDDMFYAASEECAIRVWKKIWTGYGLRKAENGYRYIE